MPPRPRSRTGGRGDARGERAGGGARSRWGDQDGTGGGQRLPDPAAGPDGWVEPDGRGSAHAAQSGPPTSRPPMPDLPPPGFADGPEGSRRRAPGGPAGHDTGDLAGGRRRGAPDYDTGEVAGPDGGRRRGAPGHDTGEIAGPDGGRRRGAPGYDTGEVAGPDGGRRRGAPGHDTGEVPGPDGGRRRGAPGHDTGEIAGPDGGRRRGRGPGGPGGYDTGDIADTDGGRRRAGNQGTGEPGPRPRWTTTSRASPDLAAARAAAVGSGAHARLSARPDLTRAPVPVAVLAPHPSRTAVRAHPPGAPHPSLRRWCRGGRERHRRPVRAPVVVARRWTRPDRARASGRRRSPARVHPSGRTDHLGHVDRWAPTAAQVRKTARGWPTAPAWRPGHAFPAGRDGQPAHVPAAVRMAQERVADRVAPEPAGPRCRVDQAFRADPACPADPA
ncbi:hypothetical protein ACFQ1L_37615 [Phytohabitans flavus]|uniref:hypothetical protein n=1 Tax=Phytohabitans flavus TaxID=1076124 RepID=UPI00364470BB